MTFVKDVIFQKKKTLVIQRLFILSVAYQKESTLYIMCCIAAKYYGKLHSYRILLFSSSPVSEGDFKHVKTIPTTAIIQLLENKTYQLQQAIEAEETKVKNTHTVFTFMLNGSEPFTINQRNLRYIIYKAAMLVHSQNTKSENQTMLKTQLCSAS